LCRVVGGSGDRLRPRAVGTVSAELTLLPTWVKLLTPGRGLTVPRPGQGRRQGRAPAATVARPTPAPCGLSPRSPATGPR
jgi:hypothetical protein